MMADSSAIDDTAAEARDLLLGDMATHVLDDVNGRIHAAVPGFHETFFLSNGDDMQEHQALAQKSLENQPHELWDHPAAPFVKRTLVGDLFSRVEELSKEGKREYVGRDDPRLDSIEFQGKPDFVLVPKQQHGKEPSSIWCDVLALGSVREASSRGYQQAFLQLCGQAQAVFQHQPTRRFLHAFSVYGFTLEFLVLDRAGVISSEPLDLHEEYVTLIKVMLQYAAMTDEQLGIGSFIDEDDEGRHVRLSTVHRDATQKLYTHEEPLAWPAKLLALPGAYCLQASAPGSTSADVVVKFIWESPSKRREIEILNHATRRGVWGVPQVLGHQILASTRDIRKQFNLGSKRMVPPQSIQRPSLGEEMLADMDRTTSTEKFNVYKNCLHSSTVEEDPSSQPVDIPTAHSSDEFELTCVATAPHGRPLASFKSISEALFALRDAVKAHRSLYNKARILHCDISRNNIIIPDTIPSSDSPHGILIDFDESVDLDAQAPMPASDDDPSAGLHAVEIRGTRAFIAIDLMRGSPHTYRHDLESFLYVFLHLAISYRSPDPPMTSRLNAWQTLDPWPELAAKKLAMIGDEKQWSILTEEFTPSWEGFVWLADELREVLFKTGEGGMFLGTEEGEAERENLYNKVIDAFDRAIQQAEHKS